MAFCEISICVAVFAIVMYAVRLYCRGTMCPSQARLDGKTVIVTGANTGIGKETALDLARRGGRVILACRSVQRGEEAAADIRQQLNTKKTDSNVIMMKLDLSSLASVRQFVEEFKKNEKRLDILVNNAGVGFIGQSKTQDGFEMVFGVNHLGHFLLTNLLLDVLKKSAPSRIVTVSSHCHKWGLGNKNGVMQFDDLMFDKEYNYIYAYAQSKVANIMFTRHLGKLLNGTGVTTYSISPGMIRSDMGREMFIFKTPGLKQLVDVLIWPFFQSLTEGAQTTVCCAVDQDLANESGKYYENCKEAKPATEVQNDDDAQRLWDVSAKLVKL